LLVYPRCRRRCQEPRRVHCWELLGYRGLQPQIRREDLAQVRIPPTVAHPVYPRTPPRGTRPPSTLPARPEPVRRGRCRFVCCHSPRRGIGRASAPCGVGHRAPVPHHRRRCVCALGVRPLERADLASARRWRPRSTSCVSDAAAPTRQHPRKG
jgi:hypothetical protein